jgi:hypothetical protein
MLVAKFLLGNICGPEKTAGTKLMHGSPTMLNPKVVVSNN